MPYIKKEIRDILSPKEWEARLEWAESANNSGELNYQLTQLIIKYIQEHGLNYTNLNDCLGALEGAKFEFYRRVVAPYEDKKIKENGDVYG